MFRKDKTKTLVKTAISANQYQLEIIKDDVYELQISSYFAASPTSDHDSLTQPVVFDNIIAKS